MYFCLLGFAWLMFGFYTKLGVRKSMQWIALIALVAGSIAFTARTQNPNAQYYQQSTATVSDRASWFWSDMALSFEKAGLIGAGTGTLSQGIQYIPGGLEWSKGPSSAIYIWGETGLGKVTEELGLTGAVAFVVFLLSMGITWFAHLRRLQGTAAYPLGAALAVYFSLMIGWFAKGHMILGDPITLVQFWLGMGVFFALPSYLRPQAR
jgi:hypothetical protein